MNYSLVCFRKFSLNDYIYIGLFKFFNLIEKNFNIKFKVINKFSIRFFIPIF
jgi:hypothetical protein